MIYVVVGKYENDIKNIVNEHYNNILYIRQEVPLGTGDAIKCCLPYINADDNVLILNGDMPLIDKDILDLFISNSPNAIGSTEYENPRGYGRIIQKDGRVYNIEEKNSSEEERICKHVNAGIYYFKGIELQNKVPLIVKNELVGEYYITDLIEMIQPKVINIPIEINFKLLGVNNLTELDVVNKIINGK